MKLFRFSALLLLAFAGNVLIAQEQPYSLTLDQACEYALQHNKMLLNARDQVTSSTHKIREARAQGLPQVDGSVDYMTYFNYEMNFSFGGGGETPVVPDFTQAPYDLGDAATYNAIMQMIGGMSSSEPIIMDDQMSGKVQVSQLLFSGQFWAGLQIAKLARELANQNVVKTEQDTKESVTNSYYLILLTEQNLKIIKGNIENLTAMLEHTTNMYKTGMAEETDVDQIKITLSQLKDSQKAVERSVQMGYNMLRFQLSVAPETKLVLTDSIDKILLQINPDVAYDPAFNITENIDFSLMESQVKMSEKQLGMQNWAYAPTAAGFYSYTEKFITTGFDMTPNHLAGFTVTVPIFSSGMRQAKVSQAKIDLDIAQRNRDNVKESLELQKNQLLFNYQSAMENYITQKENVNVANRVYTNIQNKYKQGMASSLDLTQSNNNLLNAEMNYLSSALTLLQAQTSLKKLYNKI